MHSTFSFCPKCGGKLVVKHLDGRDRQVCSLCRFVYYRNPIPAAGVIVIEDNCVLLVKRKYAPYIGYWCLPAGFVEWEEGPEECALREAKEETNLDLELKSIHGVYAAGESDDYKIMLVFYLAERIGGDLKPGDDATDARFFHLAQLPTPIAFSIHRQILKDLQKQHL